MKTGLEVGVSKQQQKTEQPDTKDTVRTEQKPLTGAIQKPQTGVKIIEEILKKDVVVEAKPGPSKAAPKDAPAPNNNKTKQETKIAINQEQTNNLPRKDKVELQRQAAIAVEEDVEEYDTKTLKPQNAQEWECVRCTFLNPSSSRLCAMCAHTRAYDKNNQKVAEKRQKKRAPQPANKNDLHYLQLLNLDNADLVENTETFNCPVCFLDIPPKDGVTLRDCLHQFCKTCLKHTIEYAEEAQVKCPYRDEQYSCDTALQDREIKALVPAATYDQYLAKSVAQAENKIDKSFHCKTPDCKGWCIFEDNVNEFRCPVCRKVNCLTCQVRISFYSYIVIQSENRTTHSGLPKLC